MNTDRWTPRRIWPPALAAALVLLLSFHQVVSGAVRQAHAGRQATAQRDQAMQHCERLADHASRMLCTSRTDARWLAAADGAQAALAGGGPQANRRR